MQAARVNLPLSDWGCEGGKTDTVPTLTKRRAIGKSIVACFENPTIASEADAAQISWRFYADSIEGFGGFWSSYQADKANLQGSRLEGRRRQPALCSSSPTSATANLAAITWIAPLWPNSRPSRRYSGGRRARVGRQPRERDRHQQVLGLDGDLRHLGRLGRLFRSRAAAVRRLRRARFPRADDRRFAVHQTRQSDARPVRDRERASLHRRQLWAGAACERRCARKRIQQTTPPRSITR